MNREAQEKQHLIETLYIREKRREKEKKYCSRKGKEEEFDEDKKKMQMKKRETNKQTNKQPVVRNRIAHRFQLGFFFFLASKRVEFHSFPHPETTTILPINNRQNATHNSNTIHTDTTLNKNLR